MKRFPVVPVLLVPALALTLTAGSALAQQWPTSDPSYTAPNPLLAPAAGFGSPGTIVVSSDFDLGFEYSNPSGAAKGQMTFKLAPSLAFFLMQNLAVGGFLDLTHTARDGGSTTSFSVGPLVGYNIPLSQRLSLMPTLGIGYAWTKNKEDLPGGARSSTTDGFTLVVRAPVLFHPLAHVFVGLAPYVNWGLSAKNEGVDLPKQRDFGVTLDLGFWL